jgi:hypothetical protein
VRRSKLQDEAPIAPAGASLKYAPAGIWQSRTVSPGEVNESRCSIGSVKFAEFLENHSISEFIVHIPRMRIDLKARRKYSVPNELNDEAKTTETECRQTAYPTFVSFRKHVEKAERQSSASNYKSCRQIPDTPNLQQKSTRATARNPYGIPSRQNCVSF